MQDARTKPLPAHLAGATSAGAILPSPRVEWRGNRPIDRT